MEIFIANLEKAVAAAGIYWREVARRSGVSESSISNIRAGREGLSVPRAGLLAAAVGYSLDKLFNPDFTPKKSRRSVKHKQKSTSV